MSRKPSHQSPLPSAAGTADRPAPYRLPTLTSTDPAAHSVPEPSPTGSSNGKKRRLSKVMADSQLPPLGGIPAMSESELASKRNKLGYQRISIACGECRADAFMLSLPWSTRLLIRQSAHCRRRKIRCLVAEGDLQGRCQNCIRLKKDCVFYPVDQQGAIDDQAQAFNQTPAGSAPDSVTSSSPSASERPFESTTNFNGYQMTSSANGSFQSLDMVTGIPGVYPCPGSALSNPELMYC